jgi:flavin-dependent dehydrogenase
MLETDVLVVGGGPAGLAAAIAARGRGLKSLVVDLDRPPIDKACGEGLMPEGLRLLDELGVKLDRDDAPEFRGIRFVAENQRAEGRFRERYGRGIRRTTLHQRMVERAAEAGVVLRWRQRVELGSNGSAVIGGEAVSCKWIVGADGYDSRVRKWAQIAVKSSRRRIGIRRHYRVKPWTDLVEVYWRDAGQAYVTPVGAEQVCVGLLGTMDNLRIPELPAIFPDLASKLGNAAPSTAPRGSVSSSIALKRVTRGKIALIGDASGTVDSITGDGLSLAFSQALALARAMERDDLSLYAAAHRRICRMPKFASRMLLLLNDHRGLRERAINALAAHGELFSQFLAVHSGVVPPTSLGLGSLAGFAWELVAPGV